MTVPCRRGVLMTLGGALVVASGPAAALATLTPRQTPGPFYPKDLPLDSDADLTVVQGHGAPSQGTPVDMVGTLLNAQGGVVGGARIEIWQCDAFGRYHHPADGGGGDPGFQGFGRTETDAKGRYRFRTIKPVPYPGRTPHIHMRIVSGAVDLTTQVYVEGETRNATDFLYGRLKPAERDHVTVPFESDAGLGGGVLLARFDPVILG